MTQKVIRVGTSAAVIIPKKSLAELEIEIGDEVIVDTNPVNKKISISRPSRLSLADQQIAKLTLNFINRYRQDLRALANK